MTTRIRAKRDFSYGGAWRKVGDVFNATNQDARTLEAIGKASVVVDEIEPPAAPAAKKATKTGAYQTRDMAAEKLPTPKAKG